MKCFFSPAKLNLFLKVVGLRKDGYHELNTLMQAISLCDELHIARSDQDLFSCSGSSALPMDDNNLVVRAVTLFRKTTNWQQPLRLHLEKRIPQQSGLGGGSSNSATALFACNEFAGKPLSKAQLDALAAQLGSDLNFFFSSGAAYCSGRGEQIEECTTEERPSPTSYQLLLPPFGSNTPAVYKAYKELSQEEKEAATFPDPILRWKQGQQLLFNDLEAAAFKVVPQLKTLFDQLQAAGLSPRVSGSGSTLYFVNSALRGKSERSLTEPWLQGCQQLEVKPLYRSNDCWYHPVVTLASFTGQKRGLYDKRAS